VHYTSVAKLLRPLGYRLQANRKTREGSQHPDRDAQFRHINEQVREYQATKDPVVSVDAKQKELVGEFKNGGPRASRSASRVTTSPTWSWAKRSRTASTTWPPTPAG
jgi:hypothetical protein